MYTEAMRVKISFLLPLVLSPERVCESRLRTNTHFGPGSVALRAWVCYHSTEVEREGEGGREQKRKKKMDTYWCHTGGGAYDSHRRLKGRGGESQRKKKEVFFPSQFFLTVYIKTKQPKVSIPNKKNEGSAFQRLSNGGKQAKQHKNTAQLGALHDWWQH